MEATGYQAVASAPMPQFQSHKKVWALKIKHVDLTGEMAHLIFEGDTFAPLSVSIENRPEPQAGWYFVKYPDGYYSFSPAKQFEEGYTSIGASLPPAGFGWALKQLHNGARVRRSGWNGKGMFLFLVPGSTFKVNRAPLLGIYPEGTEVNYCPHVDMKTADGKVVPWLCSQTDMLATDWEIAD